MALGVNVVIGAGCKTLLVCFAEDPEHLKDIDPELYAAFSGKCVAAKDEGTTSTGRVKDVGLPPAAV